MELTSTSQREDAVLQAKVESVRMLSPTVKGLGLNLLSIPSQSFQARQWLDLFIPSVAQVGGFSMCSSPLKLQKEARLDLAVKQSTWAPAKWVHTQCKEGDLVELRFGGDFSYPLEGLQEPHAVYLIAGG